MTHRLACYSNHQVKHVKDHVDHNRENKTDNDYSGNKESIFQFRNIANKKCKQEADVA